MEKNCILHSKIVKIAVLGLDYPFNRRIIRYPSMSLLCTWRAFPSPNAGSKWAGWTHFAEAQKCIPTQKSVITQPDITFREDLRENNWSMKVVRLTREKGHFPAAVTFDAMVQVCHFFIFKQSLHTEGRPQGPLDDVYTSGSSHQVKMWRASRKNEGRFSKRFFEII